MVLLLKDPMLTAGGQVRNDTVHLYSLFFLQKVCRFKKSLTCDLISHDKIWSCSGLYTGLWEDTPSVMGTYRHWAYLEDLMSRFTTPTKFHPSKEQNQGCLSIYRERSWLTSTVMLDILGQYPNMHKNRKSSGHVGATFSECSMSCGHGLDLLTS